MDEFRASPTNVGSGLNDRPYPVQMDGEVYNESPAPTAPEKKADDGSKKEDAATPAKKGGGGKAAPAGGGGKKKGGAGGPLPGGRGAKR